MKINLSGRDKNVILNVLGTFFVKGISVIISVMLLPAYMRFFHEQAILGIWYTILSVLNWVNLFDLGLGHGLRNKLPYAIEIKDRRLIREYVSTTYFLMGSVALILTIIGSAFIPHLNWNGIFNISPQLIDNRDLIVCVQIVFCGITLQLVLKIITSILFALQKAAVVNAMAIVTNGIILLAVSLLPSRSMVENLRTMSFINVVSANLPFLICSFFVFGKELKGCFPKYSFVKKAHIKSIFNIGISLLWLQIVYMVISSTNELMISNFTSPEYVVDYQAYFKIFKTISMIVALALTPIWSAVTQAQIQKDYRWIKKVYYIFLLAALACFILELCTVPFLKPIMDIWLGPNNIAVVSSYAVIFCVSSAMMVLHQINTQIGNGLSYFKVQMIWMSFAGIICIPLSYLLVKICGSWIGVVLGTTIALVPYEILAPIFTFRKLNGLQREKNAEEQAEKEAEI